MGAEVCIDAHFRFATHRHAATVGDASICFASRGICNLNQDQLHRSEPSDEIISTQDELHLQMGQSARGTGNPYAIASCCAGGAR